MESIVQIKELLEKFYAGNTDLEEEERLTRYFSTGQVPEELLADKELFGVLGQPDDEIDIPDGLNYRLEQAIDNAERKENRTRHIGLFSLTGLAAGLMIMLAVYLVYLREDNPNIVSAHYSDTYNDPMQAYEETMKALNYVSSRFNDGTKSLKPLSQVNKSVQQIQPLSLINRGQKELQIIGKFDKNRNEIRQ